MINPEIRLGNVNTLYASAASVLAALTLAACSSEEQKVLKPEVGVVIGKEDTDTGNDIEAAACVRTSYGGHKLATEKYLRAASKEFKKGYRGQIIKAYDINSAGGAFEKLQKHPVVSSDEVSDSPFGHENEKLECSGKYSVDIKTFNSIRVGSFIEFNRDGQVAHSSY